MAAQVEARVKFGEAARHKFIVHLYRLSREPDGRLTSGRDWSPLSKRILSKEEVRDTVGQRDIELYYVMFDSTNIHESGVWCIRRGTIEKAK